MKTPLGRFIATLALVVCLTGCANSQYETYTAIFKVLSPATLKNEFSALKGEFFLSFILKIKTTVFIDLDVSVTVANFGYVPWGRTLAGNLYYAEPADACGPIKPLKSTNSSANAGESETPLVIVDRGGCTFVMKAQNVQLAGAKMLIVVDNQEENVTMTLPVDDGHGKHSIGQLKALGVNTPHSSLFQAPL